MKSGKKKLLIIVAVIIGVVAIVGILLVLDEQNQKEEQERLTFLEKFNTSWYDDTGLKLTIHNLNLNSCSYEWRGLSDFFNMSNCELEIDEENQNLKLTYTLKITDNGQSTTQEVEKNLKYNDDVTELILQNDGTSEEDYVFTKEDNVEDFNKDYHVYYLTNNGVNLKMYPHGLCAFDFSPLTQTHSMTGSYAGATLNVVYNGGNCSYTTTDYRNFVIKYDGTFTAVMIPGGDFYRNRNVVDTPNNEIHITFDDDDVVYQEPQYTNGEWEIGSITYYKSN